jgi:tetratricopeptide (TPR) repeat protein
MFEMLGNQFFLVRNYSRAAEVLEEALLHDRKNKAIRKKLIICYTQTGEIEKALDLFISLINEDINFLINTNLEADDCPCIELVFDLEKKLVQNRESLDYHLILGMLWLYCDLKKSIKYFNQAHKLDPSNQKMKSVLGILNAQFSSEEKV